jgi:hypothetical protein
MGRRLEYDELPIAVRQYYSRVEYDWLSDEQKERIMEAESLPEVDGD